MEDGLCRRPGEIFLVVGKCELIFYVFLVVVMLLILQVVGVLIKKMEHIRGSYETFPLKFP